ncbi:MAG: FAD-dependent oxidoreductase [Beijerinckiaceae bacterium]|nr:FAD-dependent oxidoreductase [Beijerinckiaceae bacterium]
MSEPLVIIGQGMAGTKLAEELSQRALGRYSVILVGAEPYRAYNRVLLSSLLAKEVAAGDIELKPRGWWARQGITNVFGQPVSAIDRATKSLRFENGVTLGYSKLVIATGSHAIRLPKPGMDLPGVITFRTMDDVERMLSGVAPGRPAVVIGGGLLGLEAAYGLAKAGVRVTLLHLAPRLMERQLDDPAALLLKQAIESKGCEVLLGADTARVLGETHAEGIELVDGRHIPADLVVCAVGVRPNADLARAAGLACNRGILADDQMRTSDPDIFAIGECAEHRGIAYGLVEPAYEQARTLARNLAGDKAATYEGSILATNLKVSGVSLFSAGDFLGENKETLVYTDPAQNIYKKLVIEGPNLTGAVLYGDTADGLWYLDLIKSKADITRFRDDLIFGRVLATKEAA